MQQKPIYLYIKTHNITGLKYFGKTVSADPHAYTGSGLTWKRHCTKHGFDYTTEIVGKFYDVELAKEYAIKFSRDNDIVRSRLWANLKEETLDGGFDHVNGEFKQVYVEKAKKTVEQWNEEYRKSVNASKACHGADNGMYGRDRSGINNPRYGVILSDETKQKISKGNTGKKRTEEYKQMASKAAKKYWTEENKKKRSELYKARGHKPITACKGTVWWNNGIVEIRKIEQPGIEWKRGRIKRE